MRKRKTVLDTEIGKRIDLETYYTTNPSCINVEKGFDINCKKCGGKYILLGVSSHGYVEGTFPVISSNMRCLECDNIVFTVPLGLSEEGWLMVDKAAKK